VRCTEGADVVFAQQFKPNEPYSRPPICEQDSKGGMSNEFGEIQREDLVIYRIKMLSCFDVYVVDHCSWREVLVGFLT